MSLTTLDRRSALKRIGAGTALLVGGVGTASADDGEAALRVAHGSPDAPAVDVYVDGTAVIESLEFREVTDYLEVPAGEYTVAVNVAGTDTTVFGPVDLELAAEDYTALARGEVTGDDTAFTVSVFEDTNGANIGGDEARIRAIHGSPDAPAVDVTVDDDALTLFEDVSYGESSGYAVVPAGTYDVEIRAAASGAEVFQVDDLALEGRSTYTAFALGYLTPDDEPADEPFGVVPTLDRGAPPRGDGNGRGPGGSPGRGRGRGR